MSLDDAIIRPTRGRYSPKIGPMVAMVSNKDDLIMISEQLNLKEETPGPFYLSRLYFGKGPMTGFTALGPYIGAPYAAMLLENVIAGGAKRIVCCGWCGAISPDVKIGDVVVPTGAFIDEGTSKHYGHNENRLCHPSPIVTESIITELSNSNIPFHSGYVWTTDAVYRETRQKVIAFKQKDALAVEMELSAIFTVSRYRGVDAGAILVVSDSLSTLSWKPGFRDEQFKKRRREVLIVIKRITDKFLNAN